MPEIEIRPAMVEDIPQLVVLDHDYVTEYAWQVDFYHDIGESQFQVHFRKIHLPRSVRVNYPRPPNALLRDWQARSELLVTLHDGQVMGYISLSLDLAPATTWVTDLVVSGRFRRQGVATACVLAGLEWAAGHGCSRMVLEMQPKNDPGIRLAQKLGFEFCGYADSYYLNRDIAFFFARSV